MVARTFDDVLICPAFSSVKSRSDCDLTQRFKYFDLGIPLISANMDTITGPKMCVEMHRHGGMGILHRYMDVEDTINHLHMFSGNPAVAVGCLDKDRTRIEEVLEYCRSTNCSVTICVDIAHGWSLHMRETLDYLRPFKAVLPITIIAGNVATRSAARDLFKWGADFVKVGIGPGSVCTTRTKTGVGVPQITAIQDCALEGPVIADGGIRTPGDAAKAIAAGAHLVMIGGILAGTDCIPQAECFDLTTATMIPFRGMASREARQDYAGDWANEEGVSVVVKFKGIDSTMKVIKDITEGIRSAMSYTGSFTLEDFRRNAVLNYVTPSCVRENSAHFKGT